MAVEETVAVATLTEGTEEPPYAEAECRRAEGRLGYRIVKRLFDIVFSVLALIILSPLLLVVAILIKKEDGGPVIYTRYCIGKGEKLYKMYKFRTMKPDAGDLDKWLSHDQIERYTKEVKLKNDPRVTRIGEKLRRYSIDELPQLLSILQSSMSLVGPRPMSPEDSAQYGVHKKRVLDVKPGLTGYWQVNGRNDCTYESGKRQELDLYYADHQSLLLDLKIILKTFPAVFSGKGI
jgi:lipopolysaccharide/colanic/teichoic acid biosynthesis glycosyltransferase